MVEEVLTAAFGLLIISWYVYRYWRGFKYLRMKWRAIDYYERENRRRKGLCEECGYDLRATPEAGGTLLGCCPECGAIPRRAC